jgi:hypothetical protein
MKLSTWRLALLPALIGAALYVSVGGSHSTPPPLALHHSALDFSEPVCVGAFLDEPQFLTDLALDRGATASSHEVISGGNGPMRVRFGWVLTKAADGDVSVRQPRLVEATVVDGAELPAVAQRTWEVKDGDVYVYRTYARSAFTDPADDDEIFRMAQSFARITDPRFNAVYRICRPEVTAFFPFLAGLTNTGGSFRATATKATRAFYRRLTSPAAR